MPDDLSVAIERLRTSTQRLNTLCDTGAHVVRDVEAFLEECQVGIPAYIKIKLKHEEESGETLELGLSYCRLDSGKFGIGVVVGPANGPPFNDIYRPWFECSRNEKLEALEKLPDLLLRLAQLVEERAAMAERAVATVSSLLQLPKKRKGGA